MTAGNNEFNFICKDGREFKNKQSLLNHFRHIYPTLTPEEVYLRETGNTPIKCKFCDNDSKFLSFFKGYSDRCDSIECIKKSKENGIQLAVQSRLNKKQSTFGIEFTQYIIKNLKFYKENLNKINIIDPFTKENTGELSLDSYISRLSLIKNELIELCCPYCNKKYNICILYDQDYCHSKSCIQKKILNYGVINKEKIFDIRKLHNCFVLMTQRGFTRNEILEKFQSKCSTSIRSFIRPYVFSKSNDGKTFKCPETRYIFPIITKFPFLYNWLIENNININEYYLKYLPEYISFCRNCGTVCDISKDLCNKSNKSYCCEECYFIRKRTHPEEYQISEETRNKLSFHMKKNIQNGKITPQRNLWNSTPIFYKNKRFRSSWECIFYVATNETLEYETLRIKYFDSKLQKIRTYIIDFIDRINKIVYEIKPNSMEDQNTKDKENSLIIWCEVNQFTYEKIDNIKIQEMYKRVYEKLPNEVKRRGKAMR